MHVFKAEIKDGIGNLVEKSNSVAFFSEVIPYSPDEIELNKIKSNKAVAEATPSVNDLYYVKSILASVGWNKNDDVFDPVEMWNARNSPVDKPFNYMHEEKDIIGHMVNCYAMDDGGNILPDFNDMSQVPSAFDIVTGAVLYKSWTDKKLKARMDSIIANIEDGKKWHVSMECLFPAFDYAMIDSKGDQKIVKREESSAFLTKHLRAYGGKGEYEGYKVGRLLRNFTFSGVGLVEKPANPRSVILNHTNKKTINFSESQAEEINMTDELELLKAELAAAKKAKEEAEEEAKKAKTEAEEAKKAKEVKAEEEEEEMKKAKTKAEEDAEEAKKAKVKAEEEAKKAKEEAEEAKKAKADAEEELKKMKKEKMMEKRKASLVEAGVSDPQVASQFEALADDMFETVVAVIKQIKTVSLPAKTPDAPKYSPAGDDLYPRSKPDGSYRYKVGDGKYDPSLLKDAKSSEEFDSNEADASVLETAEASPNQIPMVDTAEEESVRSFASEWFSSKVLKSTANIK
jgi:hypothetical protein